ncbi:MAG TPA: YciK family oxidoreductase [Gammaproteobacteria bacterium]|nr:YciK family oxidoreductase [Gammaproteobacteria bacterium]
MKDYQPRPDLLKDRVILVTGAAGAIGSAAAKAFAAHGATVALLDNRQVKMEKVYDAIIAGGHPQPAICPLDLEKASPEHYVKVAEMLDKEFGRLDGILHAAGLLGTLTPLDHYDLAQWSKVMHVNLNAAYLMTRACLDLLRRSDDASIVFNSTREGRKGKAYWGAYGISHAAIENMMEIFADELEACTNIRANSIDPGPVRGRMRALSFPGEDPNAVPEADAIMADYLYLMGPDSKGVTGQRFGV